MSVKRPTSDELTARMNAGAKRVQRHRAPSIIAPADTAARNDRIRQAITRSRTMTQIEQDRDRLTKYAANPTARFQVVGLSAISLVFLILAMSASLSDQGGIAIMAILFVLTGANAAMVTIRYLMIEPLVREVRRLRDELDHLNQPKESAS